MKHDFTAEFAGRLMGHPAIAYHEHRVRDEVEAILNEHGVPFKRDRFGNVLARWQTGARVRPVVLAAHMDHPGFEILRPRGRMRWEVRFRGGVPPQYFRNNVPVRLMPGALKGRLAVPRKANSGKYEIISLQAAAASPRFAVWDLIDFELRDGNIVGRACDDLVGVACALDALVQLKRSRAKVNVIGAFTRAEEVGFHGALGISETRSLPKGALVISLETSRELPGVTMGKGVIIRTGDKSSIFDSDATRFLTEVASDLHKEDSGFEFQRGLMSGGTCEATAYQEYGYQSAAVCVALGNYHNCGEKNKIAAEYVNAEDARGMSQLLQGAARQVGKFDKLVGRLVTRLKSLAREAKTRLPRTNAEA